MKLSQTYSPKTEVYPFLNSAIRKDSGKFGICNTLMKSSFHGKQGDLFLLKHLSFLDMHQTLVQIVNKICLVAKNIFPQVLRRCSVLTATLVRFSTWEERYRNNCVVLHITARRVHCFIREHGCTKLKIIDLSTLSNWPPLQNYPELHLGQNWTERNFAAQGKSVSSPILRQSSHDVCMYTVYSMPAITGILHGGNASRVTIMQQQCRIFG